MLTASIHRRIIIAVYLCMAICLLIAGLFFLWLLWLWLTPSCEFSPIGCGGTAASSKTVILEQPKTIHGLALGKGVKLRYENADGDTFTAADEQEHNIREIFVDYPENQNAATIQWGDIHLTSASVNDGRLRILPDYRRVKEITAKQHEFFRLWQSYCLNTSNDSEGFGRIGILSIDLIDSENWQFNPDNFKYVDCDSHQFAADSSAVEQQTAIKQFNQALINLRYGKK